MWQLRFVIDLVANWGADPAVTLLFYVFHRHKLCTVWQYVAGSYDVALRYFDKQSKERLKGNRDVCAPGKSIESDYLEREQMESQGGPCHVYNLSLPLPGAIAVSPVSAVSGWLESIAAQTESSQPSDKPSRDAAPQQASVQGQVYFVKPPCLQDLPF